MSSAIAGPAAARHLADFGAEVIKIESSNRPDIARLAPPYAPAKEKLNRSGYFSAYNAGKLSLSLNMNHADGIELLTKLIEKADVLLEAFRPGVMARWGFNYEHVKKINPRIIMASHSLQGQIGPMAKHRGFGHLAAATTGWFDITGPSVESPPTGPYSAFTDFISWPILLSSILLALEELERSGEGIYIDQSHVDTSAYFAAPELLRSQSDDPPKRQGNHDDHLCPNNVYPCKEEDRWCAITINSDLEWARLCQILDISYISERVNFYTRKKDELRIDKVIAEKTQFWQHDELVQILVDQGIAAGVVYRAQDLYADPQIKYRQSLVLLDHDDHGQHYVLAPSFKLDGIKATPRRAFPSLGEHNEYICKSILGISGDDYQSMIRRGVLS